SSTLIWSTPRSCFTNFSIDIITHLLPVHRRAGPPRQSSDYFKFFCHLINRLPASPLGAVLILDDPSGRGHLGRQIFHAHSHCLPGHTEHGSQFVHRQALLLESVENLLFILIQVHVISSIIFLRSSSARSL